jgi:hypothetical protein
VAQVRNYGGALEHPWLSTLWDELGLRKRPHRDGHGWLLPVDLHSFGFKAKKRTGIYIVGAKPGDIPPIPLVLGEATHTIGLWSGRDRTTCRPSIAKREFDSTPPAMAQWLVDVARSVSTPSNPAGPDEKGGLA